MPKVLLYITLKGTYIFLFYGTDVNENRAQVHIGQRSTNKYCKIWLEPSISVASKGDLTNAQIKHVLQITKANIELLIGQWDKFKRGETIKLITINN